MYWYYGDSSYILFMVISLAVTLYAQIKVKNAFNKYSNIRSARGLTGYEAANEAMRQRGRDKGNVELSRARVISIDIDNLICVFQVSSNCV